MKEVKDSKAKLGLLEEMKERGRRPSRRHCEGDRSGKKSEPGHSPRVATLFYFFSCLLLTHKLQNVVLMCVRQKGKIPLVRLNISVKIFDKDYRTLGCRCKNPFTNQESIQ